VKSICSANLKDFTFTNYNLLIIEDTKSLNNIITKEFVSDSFNCFSVMTLKDAYEIIKIHKIYYIIFSITKFDDNDLEFIKRFEHRSEKIFVLSSESDKYLREFCYEKGVVDYIIKDKNFLCKIEQIKKTMVQLEKNKSKTILIVDNSLMIQEHLKNLLSNRYYTIEIASNIKEALDIINNKKIDLMFLDVVLGNENGIHFLEKYTHLIVDTKKIATIVIASNIDAEILRDGLQAGAVDIIRKPYIVEEIILKADLWIDYKSKADEILCATQILTEYKDAVDERSIVSKSNLSGVITYVNAMFCELSGYTKEELLGKNHNILRHYDMPSEIYADLWFTIKELKQTWQGKIKNKKKDGSYYWVDALIKPIINSDGEIEEFIALRNDITESENLKNELKKQYFIASDKYEDIQYLSKLYENAIEESNIILRIDLNRNITYVNEMFCKISGYSFDEVVGKSYSIIQHPDVNNEDLYNIIAIIDKENIWKGDIKNISKDGQTYHSLATVVPIKNKNGKIIEYMSMRKDITELVNLHTEIEETQRELIYKLGEIGETRSKETGNHVKRVAEYSKLLALLYGLSNEEAELLKYASPMHDIGKIGIADNILNKPGRLTIEEFAIMKKHAAIGYDMLKGSNRKILKTSAIVANEHHEKWDGSGYPKGLEGENIHIYGRITAIADVFDALASDRPYKKAWDLEKILELFREQKGKHFDPYLIDLFFENLDKFLKIKNKFK